MARRPKSLLEKFSTLVASNVTEVIGPLQQRPRGGRAITIAEYIRHIESDIKGIDKTAHEMIERVRSLQERLETFKRQSSELDQLIDQCLTRGNNAAAARAQKQLNSIKRQATIAYEENKEWESRLLILKEKRDRFEVLLADAQKKAAAQAKSADDKNVDEESGYWVIE